MFLEGTTSDDDMLSNFEICSDVNTSCNSGCFGNSQCSIKNSNISFSPLTIDSGVHSSYIATSISLCDPVRYCSFFFLNESLGFPNPHTEPLIVHFAKNIPSDYPEQRILYFLKTSHSETLIWR